MARELPIIQQHTAFMKECEARIAKMQEIAEQLSDADVAALAKDIVTYFNELDKANPLSVEEQRDLLQYLSQNRGAAISLGNTIQLFGSTALWAGFGYSVIGQGNIDKSILFAAQTTMQAARLFGTISGPTGQKMMAKIRGLNQRMMHGEAVPKLQVSSPAVAEVLSENQSVGEYLVQHREQVIMEGMAVAQAMGIVGWTPLVLQGDGYAATAMGSTAFSLMFTALMVGQTYHRNYRVEDKPEPKRFNLPNQKFFAWVADSFVEPMSPNTRSAAELAGFCLSCISVPAIMMQGVASGDYIQAASTAVITAGLLVARVGFMIPPSQKVLNDEDAVQFRESWNALMYDYSDKVAAKFIADLEASQLVPKTSWARNEKIPEHVQKQLDQIKECGKQMTEIVKSMKFLPASQKSELMRETKNKFDALIYELTPGRQF